MTEAGEAALAGWLAGRRVLVAYGLFGEASPAVRLLGLDYMGAQQDWLRRMGALPEVVRVPTADSVAGNAATLREALLAEERPALVLAHSKGGLEALEALLDPNAAAHCAGLIALQSPFAGSAVADAVMRRWVPRRLALGAVRLLGFGTGEGVRDLTTAARATWMQEHGGAVAALLQQLPVVTAAAVLSRGDRVQWREWPWAMARRWLERRAGPNDGLVPLASALLPGARQMVERGSHIALVVTGDGRDPVGALRRALALLLQPPAPDVPFS